MEDCDPLGGTPPCPVPQKWVLTDADAIAQYHALLAETIADGGAFSDEVISANIEATATLIRSYVQADTEKFYSTQDFETGLNNDIGNIIGLTTFVTERRAAIAAQLDGSQASSSDGEGSCSNAGPGGGGPGGPGGQHPKCPDGVCDGFEQANPDACPEDCE